MVKTYMSLFSGIGGFEVGIHKVFPDAQCLGFSEINKHAVKVYQTHFPNHPCLGDVKLINGKKYKGKVDLLVGGSPCQDFSLLNLATGEGLEGKKSSLLYEFVRLVKEIKPRYFILENVVMKKEHQDMISSLLNVDPVEINSRCVSLQKRRRLFWCNFDIKNASRLPDCPLKAKDIFLKEGDKRLKQITYYECLKRDDSEAQLVKGLKDFACGIPNPRNVYYKLIRPNDTSIRTIVSSTQSGGLFYIAVNEKKKIVRQIHPTELERLQTFPDDWTVSISKTQRYKTLGSAVVCDVVKKICECLL